MYLLYVDESGSVSDPQNNHFVLAGLCVHERQSFWIASELDEIAKRFNPAEPNNIEFHGNHMFQGKGYWRQFPTDMRIKAMQDCLLVLANSHVSNRIFACVVNKSRELPKTPILLTFEQLSSRFDYFLTRLHLKEDTHRGLMIFDKSAYETDLQNLAANFRTIGHSWGVLRNLSDVPLFIDSKATRLIQLADLISYAFFRKYEKDDDRFHSIIFKRLDKDGRQLHGLYEAL